MVMKKISADPFIITKGIDSVVHYTEVLVKLPESADLPPPETLSRPQLDQLLALPNIDEFIAAQLLPRLGDPALLNPIRFSAILVAALLSLRTLAEDRPKSARKLGRAARQLSETVNLRDLLRMYQSALLQG